VLLINAPPLLAVGDAMTIAKHADALVLVAPLNQVDRATLQEARRALDACPRPTLGVVATAGKAAKRTRRLRALRSFLARGLHRPRGQAPPVKDRAESEEGADLRERPGSMAPRKHPERVPDA
jgi:Mrp family chromosome partitioning ATPase